MKKLIKHGGNLQFSYMKLFAVLLLTIISLNSTFAQDITSVTPSTAALGDTVDVLIIGNGTTFTTNDGDIDAMYLMNETEQINAFSFAAISEDTAIGSFFISDTAQCGGYTFVMEVFADGPLFFSPFTIQCERSTDSLALLDLHNAFVGAGHPGLFPVSLTLDNWVPLTNGRVTEVRFSDLGGFGPFSIPSSFQTLDKLEILELERGDISIISLGELNNLREVYVGNNNCTSLGVFGIDSLEILHCDTNSLSDINLSGNPNLREFDCTNAITGSFLDISDVLELETIRCFNQNLTGIIITEPHFNVTTFDIQNPCIKLDSVCPSLINGSLTSLDLSLFPSLEVAKCAGNSLTSLDISGLLLEFLNCSYNQLTEINIGGTSSLFALYASHNQISTLDLAGAISLFELYIANNNLTSLDVRDANFLELFSCDSNQIINLEVAGLNVLELLSCSHNQLREFDLDSFSELAELDCDYNQLPFKFLTRIINETGYNPLYNITPQFNSSAIYFLEFDVGETLNYAEDDFSSLTLYRWFKDNDPLNTVFEPEGLLNLLFTDTLQAGDYYFESINDSFPGDTLLGPIYRIAVNDTIGSDISVFREGDLIIDFGPDPGANADTIKDILIASGAYVIDSCSCGGPVLWGIPDTVEDGINKYLNFNATRTWAKGTLDAEGGDADFNYEWGDNLPSNDDFPFTWSGTYKNYGSNDDVLLSIIDQGIDMTHPELLSYVWNPLGSACGISYDATYSGYLFPDSSTLANNLTAPIDDSGHGTGVAGIVPQAANASASIQIFNERVSGVGVKATLFKAICAVNTAISENAKVVNMSLGYWGNRSGIFEDIIKDAADANVIIVASAGNDSTDLQQYVGQDYGFFPANYTRDSFPNLITTGGYDHNKAPVDFSNFCADCVDVAGPSKNMRSAKYNTQTFGWYSGTSFTSPFVSGILASIYSGLGSGTSYQAVIDTFFRDFTVDSSLYVGLVRNQKILDVSAQYLCDIQPITVDDEVSDTNTLMLTIDPTQNDCITIPCSSEITIIQNGEFGTADVLGASNFIEYSLFTEDISIQDTIIYQFCYQSCPAAEIECGTATIYIDIYNPFTYEVTVYDSTCSPIDTGTVIDSFIAVNGWDSIVTTITELLPSIESTVSFFVCDSLEIGTNVDTFTSVNGCDSIVTTILNYAPSDSVYLFQMSCNAEDVGTEFIILSNQYDCDSVVVLVTSLLPSHIDTIYIDGCLAADTGIVIDSFVNVAGCDSLIVTITDYTLLYDVIVNETSCNPAFDERTFIEILVSSDGCDSIVTSFVTYEPLRTDTIFIETCDPSEASVSYDTLNNSTIPITYTANRTTDKFISNSIPPFGWTVDTIIISGLPTDAIINDLTLDVDLAHSWVGDLFIWLFSPDGQTLIPMLERPGSPNVSGGCSDDDMVVTFDDNAIINEIDLENICNGDVPWFVGEAQPRGSFSDNFAGQSMNGTWLLIIGDAAGGDDGILNSWSLNFDYVPIEGCDTLITTIIELLPSYYDTTLSTTCNPNLAVTTIDSFTAVSGCDSNFITITSLLPTDTTYSLAYSCNPADTGTTTSILTNQSGCDSTVITVTVLLPNYDITIVGESCEPEDTGTHVQNLTTHDGCDSIITRITTLLPSDEVTVNYTICDSFEVGTYIDTFTNISGCDSVVTTILTYSPADSVTIYLTSCDPLAADTTTIILTNQEGCDSTITTITTVAFTYDIGVFEYTCDTNEAGLEIDSFATVFGCDSIVSTLKIFSPPDETFIEETTCDPNEAVVITDYYLNQHGCDSSVTTTTSLLPSDTSYSLAYSCNTADTGTTVIVLTNHSGCDSTVITVTVLLPSYDITIIDESCEPEDTGTYVQNLTTHDGCDSIVVTFTSLIQSYHDTIYTTSCNPDDVGAIDEILTGSNGCDSIVTVVTTLVPADSITIVTISCDPFDEDSSTTIYTNQWGCDSVVTEITKIGFNYQISFFEFTCDSLEVGEVVDSFLTYQGCDSLVFTGIFLNPSFDLFINAETCNPNEVDITIDSLLTYAGCDSIITTTTSLLDNDSVFILNYSCLPQDTGTTIQQLTNQNGCDSIVTEITVLLPSYDITIVNESCEPEDTGTHVQNLTTHDGCDSIVVTITSLIQSYHDTIYTTSCNPDDVGAIDEILIGSNGCDSIVTVVTTLAPADSITIVTISCDPFDEDSSTTIYTNQWGCDSVVTEITKIGFNYQISFFEFTCDSLEVGEVVDSFLTYQGCDSLVFTGIFLNPSFDLFINAETCNPNEVDITIDSLLTYAGCDSIITTTTSLLDSDSVFILNYSCLPQDTGTTIQQLTNQNGCDSIVTEITVLLPSYDITIVNESCEPEDTGTHVQNLTTHDGCDSIVTIITSLDQNCAECETPDNLYATNISFFQATLGWDNVSGAIRYQAEGRIKNSPFGITRRRMSQNNQFRTNVLFPFLTYQFRVRTDCDNGWTDWSYWEDFTLNPFLFLNAQPITGLQVYGIPTIDLFEVDRIFLVNVVPRSNVIHAYYHGEQLLGGHIIVSDITGRQIHLSEFELVPDYSKRIELGNQIADGIYFISLIKDDIVLETEKILLTK